MNIKQVADTLLQIELELISDLCRSEKNLSQDDVQYHRRVYVRTLFASIEGTIYSCKQLLLRKNDLETNIFSNNEISMLCEKNYFVNKSGDIEEQIKYIPLRNNIKFTIKLFNKVFETDLNLDLGGNDWNNFVKANEIRDRVTHPKNHNYFQITDEEIEILKNVGKWYLNLNNHILKRLLETIPNE